MADVVNYDVMIVGTDFKNHTSLLWVNTVIAIVIIIKVTNLHMRVSHYVDEEKLFSK